MSHHDPQDEPFRHEAVIHGHRRADSSTNLLQSESTLKVDEYQHGDGFYDHAGSSQPTLYDDPEGALPHDKEIGNQNYQNFGTRTLSCRVATYVSTLADYADEDIYNESRARPLPEKPAPLSRMFRSLGNTPLNQRIEEKKRGIGRQRYPYVGEYMQYPVFVYKLIHPRQHGSCQRPCWLS